MLGLLAPTLIAFGAALLLGGSPRGLLSRGIRGWPAVIAGFAIELVLFNPPANTQPWAMLVGPWIWLVTRLVFVGVLIANGRGASDRTAWPWWLASLGLALNTLVIALNDGQMPQSVDAAVAVWGASRIDPTTLQNVAPLVTDSRLPRLADIFAEPRWLPRPSVVSLGDVLLALGVASWVFINTRR